MAFDKTKPAGTTPLKTSDDQIRANNEALETAIGQDHDFATGSTQTGKHKQVIFKAPITKPSLAADEGALFTKTVSTKSELVYEDEDGDEVQLTSGGKVNAVVGSALAVLRIIKVTMCQAINRNHYINIASIYNGDTLSSTEINGSATYYDFNVTGNCLGVLGVFITESSQFAPEDYMPTAEVNSNNLRISLQGASMDTALPENGPGGIGSTVTFTISYLTSA